MLQKISSIVLVFIFLLSGMQLSIATHLCHGNKVAVKVSFSGKTASCGMETKQTCKKVKKITGNCCSNIVDTYHTDGNYKPVFVSSPDITKKLGQNYLFAFSLPLLSNSYIPNTTVKVFTPPSVKSQMPVLEKICVFLI
jgi:hypothetical protein